MSAGSILNQLEKRGQYDCTPYIKPGSSLQELLDHLTLSCGCTSSAFAAYFSIVCRDLDVGPIPKYIYWKFQCTCKKSISAGCVDSVEELYKVWIKVPKDDDKICLDAYKRTKTLAKSCK